MKTEIERMVDAIRERLVSIRRQFHMYPEPSGEEKKTAETIAGILKEAGLEVEEGVAGTGVVGVLKGSVDGYTVALRAEMDALPIEEKTGAPYSSKVKGLMHACGHDLHMAILIGVALTLSSMKQRLKGCVKFIFQPSEEKGPGGACKMVEDGVLDKEPKPGAIFALHSTHELKVGEIGHRHGIITAASDRFRIAVKGRSAHASRPHEGVDAVLTSALVINAIHHIISRRKNPLKPAVISIGTIKGGVAANVIADFVEMEGTARTLDEGLRQKMPELIEDAIRGITHYMGGGYDFEYEFGIPPVVNDPEIDRLVCLCAEEMLGRERVMELLYPTMGAEDFSFYLKRIPGVLFRLGIANPEKGITNPIHNSSFDIDEDAIVVGTKVLSLIALRYLEVGREGS